MDKLYEVLVKYYDGEDVALIKLPKADIDETVNKIVSSGRHGKLYVIEIDTLIGTSLVNNPQNVICYYDKPELAEIVVKNNKLDIEPRNEMTFYIEKTIQECLF
ncbi:MAG: hypothetical protein GX625_06750 [Clostridiaceae bacterium]|nr:hypothetical protein [Clostridiaceae bacterium]